MLGFVMRPPSLVNQLKRIQIDCNLVAAKNHPAFQLSDWKPKIELPILTIEHNINSDSDKQLISDVITESVQDYLKAIYKLSNGVKTLQNYRFVLSSRMNAYLANSTCAPVPAIASKNSMTWTHTSRTQTFTSIERSAAFRQTNRPGHSSKQ